MLQSTLLVCSCKHRPCSGMQGQPVRQIPVPGTPVAGPPSLPPQHVHRTPGAAVLPHGRCTGYWCCSALIGHQHTVMAVTYRLLLTTCHSRHTKTQNAGLHVCPLIWNSTRTFNCTSTLISHSFVFGFVIHRLMSSSLMTHTRQCFTMTSLGFPAMITKVPKFNLKARSYNRNSLWSAQEAGPA